MSICVKKRRGKGEGAKKQLWEGTGNERNFCQFICLLLNRKHFCRCVKGIDTLLKNDEQCYYIPQNFHRN